MGQHSANDDAAKDPVQGSPGAHSGGDVSGRAGDAADRLSRLTHELSSLLDGSLRWIGLAERSLPAEAGEDPGEVDRTRKQIETVRGALERMAELVEAASRGDAIGIGSPLHKPGVAVTLGEAIDHAIDVVRPRAAEAGISISMDLESAAARQPCGPIYSVVLNGLHNAVDSILRALDGVPGEGAIGVRLRRSSEGLLALEIEDDGCGPPDDPQSVFETGVTSKQNSGGIGLALARELVVEACGRIELIWRGQDPAAGETLRPGAVLRVVWPEPGEPDGPIGRPYGHSGDMTPDE